MSDGHVAPITSSERIGELDALRGFALLGVFIANYVFFASFGFTTTPEQREVFMAEPGQATALQGVLWLVGDKANTLFGVLFGMGFWVQMSRMQARATDANRIYLRRLSVLLIMGAINLYFLWPWDILFIYALAGFILFFLRNLSMKAMLLIGTVLMLSARPLIKVGADMIGIREPQREIVFNPEAQAARNDAIVNGSYGDWFSSFASVTNHEFILSGLMLGWIFYALGRFLVGAWIARKGWLDRLAELRPQLGKIALVALAIGLTLEYVQAAASFDQIELAKTPREAVHMVGVVFTALGYACGLMWLFHSRTMGWLPRLFAPVGRMALTNYIAHGIVAMFLLTGIGPGLALAGTAGPKEMLAFAFATFVGLSIFSHLWLRAYRYGPLEYVWRTLTYGRAPAFRRKGELQAG